MYTKATLIAILAATATAFPHNVSKRCEDQTREPIGQEHAGQTTLAAGGSCKSGPADAGCELSQEASHTEGTSISVGVSAGVTISEIFSLGVSAEQSWTSEDTTGTTTTVVCPPGGWRCGAQVTPYKRTLKGSDCGNAWEVEVNALDSEGNPKMEFEACALAVPEEGYDGKAPDNFDACPGTTGLEGFPETGPALGFVPGRCGVHIVQYQKKTPGAEGEDGRYHYDVSVVDNNGAGVPDANVKGIWAEDGHNEVKGALPHPFVVADGAVDSDPVGFEYNGFKFDSDNVINPDQPVCSRASEEDGYEDGNRDIDCSFNC